MLYIGKLFYLFVFRVSRLGRIVCSFLQGVCCFVGLAIWHLQGLCGFLRLLWLWLFTSPAAPSTRAASPLAMPNFCVCVIFAGTLLLGWF